MKVLLINPPVSGERSEQIQMGEPLGLAYLAAVLDNSKYDVCILDFYALGKGKIINDGKKFRIGLSDEEILASLKDINPDIIGISCNYTLFAAEAYNVARLCKIKYPDKLIILGGAHATTMTADDLISNPYIDILVKGEGEYTLLDLSEKLNMRKEFSGVMGTMIKTKTGVIENEPRNYIYNLDSLPFPNRKYLDMDYYLKHSDIYGYTKKFPSAAMITSRGCPFNCIFCTVKRLAGQNWRSHSVDWVIAEMKHLINDYRAKEICIYDDNFIIDQKRVKEICKRMLAEKFKVSLRISSGFPVQMINYDLLSLLKKVGLYRVTLPIESGCEKTIKFIRKNINLDKVKEVIKMTNNLGLWTHGNFIVGFPYETEKDIMETINYAEKSGLDFASYLIAQPLFGSDLFDIYKQENLLFNNKINPDSRFTITKYNTKYLSASKIQYLRDRAAYRYAKIRFLKYLNPREFILYIYPKINSIGGIKYAFKLLTTKKFLKLIFNRRKL